MSGRGERHQNSAEIQTGRLKQELGLTDLVLMQFVCVLSTTWLAVAGRAGAAHVLFWTAALVLFHVPSWIKLAALSGFTMTLLFVLTAIVPVIDVASTVGFSGRVLGMFVAGNAAGAILLALALFRIRRNAVSTVPGEA